ncbi:MAG: M3 family metallopeptidase [Candidatus Aminicenantaceae bacterium]
MKNTGIILVLGLGLLTVSTSCSQARQTEEVALENPLLTEFDAPFGVPPFDSIKDEHYRPAFAEAMAQHIQEIEAIVNNPEGPTFTNTVAALAEGGLLLAQVSNVFDNLIGAHINDEMKIIEEDMAPVRTKHGLDINLNPGLFERVKAVYEQKESLGLNREEAMLLEKTYKGFVRGGANLSEDKKARFREIDEELSLLTVKFSQNVLNDTNAYQMLLESESDLAGLPEGLVTGYAEAAQAKGHEGKWLLTLHKPSFIPFLMYSEQRDLREKIFKAFANVGNNDNAFDNKAIASKTAALRVERANLLGYESHAAFILEDNMAKEAGNVYNLLMQVWTPALARAKEEVKDMQAMIDGEGGNFQLQPWDWWYYAEKVKMAKYDLDDQAIRPYFKLENVRAGMFDVANKLFGITFTEIVDIPRYLDEVQAFEVKEADGTHVGVLYTDYYPRESKQGGAWMNAYRKQYKQNGENIRPVVANHGNFSKPTGDLPALISYDEALTMFHEFGHALHGLLSDCTYRPLSGTDVPRDFVELPSQIMEHWASHPDVIKSYARHYETGEPIPDELLEKIKSAGHFNQGFATIEYLASCFLDMDWHVLSEVAEHEAGAFEKASMEKIGLISEIIPRWRSTYFQHIFAGGYSSGYYSYIWAEVLDSDAFEAFKETSLFDQKTAASLRKNILAAGGTDDPMAMYLRFRGAEPKIEPLLRKRGLMKMVK